jgi:hypothetical protein
MFAPDPTHAFLVTLDTGTHGFLFTHLGVVRIRHGAGGNETDDAQCDGGSSAGKEPKHTALRRRSLLRHLEMLVYADQSTQLTELLPK